uniref:Leopectin n=1 Tax=Boleophthalmus pectinirostris TaxID=150288 RepID=A0AA49B0M8_BOLPE|nr:leopectin [Boleophthalmus pectinirostris]
MIVVSIRNVTLSDTGTYRCGLATFNGQTFEAFVDFIINVSSVVSSNPSPGVLSPETHSEPHEHHTPLSEVALYVGLSLSALLILSVTLTSLILYRRKRARTTPGAPDIPVYAQIQEMADSSSTLTYAEVDFSKCSSAPRCLTTTTEEAPVYSTVCLPHK